MTEEQDSKFRKLLEHYHFPVPEQELKFHDTRKWRFDYAWPKHKVALEVEGGIFSGGRHTRGVGFLKDMEKYNEAVLLGWRVFRVSVPALTHLNTFIMLWKSMHKGEYAPWQALPTESVTSADPCPVSKTSTSRRSLKRKSA